MNMSEVSLDICNYQDVYDLANRAKEIFSKLSKTDEEAEALFLLGKLYYLIGVGEGINEIIKLYKQTFIEPDERHKNNIGFLELLSSNNYDENLINEIKTKYRELNDRGNYLKANILFCEACLFNENYSECI